MNDAIVQSDCCGGFASVAWRWEWFTLEDEPDVAVMPCIGDGIFKRRIHYCQFCGANIRNVQISKRWLDDMRVNQRTQ